MRGISRFLASTALFAGLSVFTLPFGPSDPSLSKSLPAVFGATAQREAPKTHDIPKTPYKDPWAERDPYGASDKRPNESFEEYSMRSAWEKSHPGVNYAHNLAWEAFVKNKAPSVGATAKEILKGSPKGWAYAQEVSQTYGGPWSREESETYRTVLSAYANGEINSCKNRSCASPPIRFELADEGAVTITIGGIQRRFKRYIEPNSITIPIGFNPVGGDLKEFFAVNERLLRDLPNFDPAAPEPLAAKRAAPETTKQPCQWRANFLRHIRGPQMRSLDSTKMSF